MFKRIPKSYINSFIVILISALILSLTVLAFDPIAGSSLQRRVNNASKNIFAIPVKCTKRSFKSDDTVISAFDVLDKEDKKVGFIFEVHTVGYVSTIKMFVGVDTEGRIIGVNIPTTEETRGIGTKITAESFTDQFINKQNKLVGKNGNATLPEEISIISGATVSSNAVISGVNKALLAFNSMEE